MGIRFRCPACGKKIHVKDFLAGKRGICPRCDAGVDIPLASQLPPKLPSSRKKKSRPPAPDQAGDAMGDEADDLVEVPAGVPLGRLLGASELPTIDPLVESPGRRWYAFAPDGHEVGPLSAADVRTMIDVGDIRAESSVRRDDWPERMIAAAVWPDWRGTDPFAALRPVGRSPEPGLPPDADSAQAPTPKLPAGSLPSTSPLAEEQPAAVDSPTLYLPPRVARAMNAATPWQASPQTAPPAAPYSERPPYSVPPADSAAPEPGLYYSRGSNASYLVALVLLTLVVAVLAATAYRVIVDPPAWLRPPQNGEAASRPILASEPSFLRNIP